MSEIAESCTSSTQPEILGNEGLGHRFVKEILCFTCHPRVRKVLLIFHFPTRNQGEFQEDHILTLLSTSPIISFALLAAWAVEIMEFSRLSIKMFDSSTTSIIPDALNIS